MEDVRVNDLLLAAKISILFDIEVNIEGKVARFRIRHVTDSGNAMDI